MSQRDEGSVEPVSRAQKALRVFRWIRPLGGAPGRSDRARGSAPERLPIEGTREDHSCGRLAAAPSHCSVDAVPGDLIAGRVVDRDGRPVTGAKVAIAEAMRGPAPDLRVPEVVRTTADGT